MVNNGCCTATRSSAGTGKKIITTARDADINIEMRMDARELRRNIGTQLANNPAFNQQILLRLSICINNNAVFYQYAHSKLQKPSGEPEGDK